MQDELQPLLEDPALAELLRRYAEAVAEGRGPFHDRVAEVEGRSAREVVRMHGRLLAHGWLEQNTGFLPAGPGGAAVPNCYRASRGGVRALRRLAGEREAA